MCTLDLRARNDLLFTSALGITGAATVVPAADGLIDDAGVLPLVFVDTVVQLVSLFGMLEYAREKQSMKNLQKRKSLIYSCYLTENTKNPSDALLYHYRHQSLFANRIPPMHSIRHTARSMTGRREPTNRNAVQVSDCETSVMHSIEMTVVEILSGK